MYDRTFPEHPKISISTERKRDISDNRFAIYFGGAEILEGATIGISLSPPTNPEPKTILEEIDELVTGVFFQITIQKDQGQKGLGAHITLKSNVSVDFHRLVGSGERLALARLKDPGAHNTDADGLGVSITNIFDNGQGLGVIGGQKIELPERLTPAMAIEDVLRALQLPAPN